METAAGIVVEDIAVEDIAFADLPTTIKTIRAHEAVMKELTSSATQEQLIQRYRRAAIRAAGVADHPVRGLYEESICNVYDLDEIIFNGDAWEQKEAERTLSDYQLDLTKKMTTKK